MMLFSRADLKRLLIPLLLEQILVVLVGMVDTMMVSSCGETAVSGVSLVDSINVLLISSFSALATGGAVLTSQFLGKKDPRQAGRSAKMLFYVVLLVSLTLMALCLFFGNPLLKLIFGTIEPEVMSAAQTYFLLSALSYPFLAMYNASCALLRSQGNAKATLVTSAVMNLINISGNALLIYGFDMGVAGAGIATLVCRFVGALMTQHALRDPHALIPCPVLHRLEWDGGLVKKILAVGLPNGFENSLFQLGKLVLVRMIATFGTISITANALGNTFGGFQVLPGNAISLAMITVVGQCVGAKEFDQARHYVKRLMQLTYAIMSVLNVFILLFLDTLLIPFNLSPETADLARQVITIHGVGSIFLWPLSFVFPNALRAAGDAKFTMTVSMISMFVFRVVFGILMGQTLGMGVIGTWLAMQIDWVFRITSFLLRWRSGKWKTKALV